MSVLCNALIELLKTLEHIFYKNLIRNIFLTQSWVITVLILNYFETPIYKENYKEQS